MYINRDYAAFKRRLAFEGVTLRLREAPPTLEQINEVIGKLGTAFEEFKSKNDQRLDEIAKRGSADVTLVEQVEKIAKELADLKAAKDKLEAKAKRPGLGGNRGEMTEDRAAFIKAIRSKAAFDQLSAKAVDADFANDTTTGGVMIPEVIAAAILQKLLDISPMRNLVTVTPVSSPNYQRLVDTLGTASGWVGETAARTETATPNVQKVVFTHGELYALPKASQWALNDLMIDVESWLINSVAKEFAYQEGRAVVSGNGSNKPTGFLNGAPVTTGDDDSPARAFGVLQYIATGKAGAFANSRVDSPAGDPGDVFIKTVYSLKAGYRQAATWTMNKSTLGTVMRFKDADGNYLWRPGLQAGQPDLLIGYPIVEAEAMPDVASNTFPVAFGDFREGYEMIDITGMSMVRDEVTSKGNVLFYVARRLGGKVTNDDAIKLIKCAAA